MKLLILGARGGVGRELVAKAAGRGHAVTAFVRSPDQLRLVDNPPVTAVSGDPRDGAALAGHDAVLSALGTGSLGPSTLLGDAARATRESRRVGRAQQVF